MKSLTLILACCLIGHMQLLSQENPKLDLEMILSLTDVEDKIIIKDYESAESYYKKGVGYYEEALKHYIRLYEYASDLPQLNYKMGVCCLYSSNQKKALQYLVRSYPDVATDYYFQLGKALQYNSKYVEAEEAYNSYQNSLKDWQKRSINNQLTQLIKECRFGAVAVQDSSPVFIKNLGPVINTYFDDYGAVLSTHGDSAIFFTSRRPKNEPETIKPRDRFEERLLVTNNCISKPSDEVNEPRNVKSKNNTAVSGIIDSLNRIFFYVGKFQNGTINTAEIDHQKLDKLQMLGGKINHIAYQETSLAVGADSTVYYITDRVGGEGGKDIWMAKWIRRNKYKKIKNIGSHINTSSDEESVAVSADGKTLYFATNGRDGMGGYDIFKCEKQADHTWGAPINMGHPINSPANEMFYHPTPDSMVALYASTRDGGFGGLDIYKIEKDPRIPFELRGNVTDIKTKAALAAKVSVFNYKTNQVVAFTNQDAVSANFSIAFKDKGPYLVQIDAAGYRTVTDTLQAPTQKHDLVEVRYQLEKLKYPFTLFGNILDAKTGAAIQADIAFKPIDNDTLILKRIISGNETGNYSITFEDKANLMMSITANGYFAYQEIINMKSTAESSLKKNIQLKSNVFNYHLTGYFYEEETGKKIAGQISLFRTGEAQPFMIGKTDSLTNKYAISTTEKGPFVLEVNAEGYFFINGMQEFNADTTLVVRDFKLKKMKTGAVIVAENILFNSGKTTLVSSSYPSLDKLAKLLVENPSVRIEVSGHTDNVGSASINKKLSKARALTVKNYLVTKGVASDRLEYEGYGFDNPIAENNTDKGKAMNRRVEIKILN